MFSWKKDLDDDLQKKSDIWPVLSLILTIKKSLLFAWVLKVVHGAATSMFHGKIDIMTTHVSINLN